MAKPFHMPPVTVNAFHRALPRWFRRHKRDLPWRRTRDPYAIWVSEIMLQQTRVETVISYYERWLKAFPTAADLARAKPERVLKLWEGLGYYSRARNLHRAAQIVAREGFANLGELPGIGPYTAGAIASIAFDRRVPLVDGNVARVFARVFGIAANVKLPATLKQLWALAETLLPAERCGEFNESLMELGALVCVPGNPDCRQCPLAKVCVANATGKQDSLPNRGKPAKMCAVIQDVAWIQRDGHVLLRQRPPTGLLAGMWELPATEAVGTPLLEVKHTIMNRRITLRVFGVRQLAGAFPCSRPKQSESKLAHSKAEWISRRQLRHLPMPAAHRRAVKALLAQ